jgi:hypothetical protein
MIFGGVRKPVSFILVRDENLVTLHVPSVFVVLKKSVTLGEKRSKGTSTFA